MDEDEPSGTPPQDSTDGAATAPPPVSGRRKLRKVLLASSLTVVVLAGLGIVGGTYYYDSVALPEDIAMDQATTIYYADGVTEMARIGDTNRTVLSVADIPVDVQHAVVAAQDPSFYSNSGVDYSEAASAAWNNLTGDERRGASTISQQYARHWAELKGVSYSRKLRESVIAMKLNEQFEKEKILELYLNIVYFGRGAYGIQAAAQAYFGKPAKDLTLAEGMLLAGLIDEPGGADGKGSPYDPTVDGLRARERFAEIRRRLLELDFVTPAEAEQKTAYPAKVLTAAETRANNAKVQGGGYTAAEGLIVHQVLGEVAALTDPKTGKRLYEDTAPDGRKTYDRIRNDGLRIVTTIDPVAQRIAVREASRNAESNLDKQPEHLRAALVAVEPGTGEVKAYYGGDTGHGGDYAGSAIDPVLEGGGARCCGGHPPGATFGPYVVATGLMAGYRIDSHWNGESPQEFPGSGRTFRAGNPVRNAGENAVAAPQCASGSARWCTLEESAVMALNTPLFGLTVAVGGARVIDTARAAGITMMWAQQDGSARRVDLTKEAGKDVFPKYVDTEVGIGQYPVTVLDQAAGMATFAARGVAAKTHFLKEVWAAGRKIYSATVEPARIPGFTEAMADDLNAVFQGVPKRYGLGLRDGRQTAGVAGAWQLANTADNSHAWMVGYTASDLNRSRGLAVAVWVGNRAEERKLTDRTGKAVIGGTLPGLIWRDFLDDTLTELNAPKVTFEPKKAVGNKTVGTGVDPAR